MAPRRVGEGDRERLLYDLNRHQPIRVKGRNVTFGCRDTGSSTSPGCGAPTPDPVEPIVPLRDPDVVLTQAGHTYTLGHLGAIGPDLTGQLEVRLPAAVRPGPAKLAVQERGSANGAELDVVIS